jgi:tetraacyldisaccharide 4'-kinase
MIHTARPLELVYHAATRTRRLLYRHRLLRQEKLPRPVFSIGNLAFGGTGKTPTTIAVAKMLIAADLRPVILTRGYGRADRTLSAEQVDSFDTARFGDEPVLLYRALPGVPIMVGSDRAASGRRFLEGSDCDVFLLDDGFQHMQLARDCDLVIITNRDRLRREPIESLKGAHVVLVRGGEYPHMSKLAADALLMQLRLRGSQLVLGSQQLPLLDLNEKKVVAFSALANNEQFFRSLEPHGANLVAKRGFRDHHRYSTGDLSTLKALAAQHEALLVTTEKDWVKINDPEIAFIEAYAELDKPDELLQHLLGHVAR